MSGCEWAGCKTPRVTVEDGWGFCPEHLAEHRAMMREEHAPAAPAPMPVVVTVPAPLAVKARSRRAPRHGRAGLLDALLLERFGKTVPEYRGATSPIGHSALLDLLDELDGERHLRAVS